MYIEENKAVAIDYVLHIDDGILVDKSSEDSPLWYLHGAGNIIPGLERELLGLQIGAQKKVTVAPEDGYGIRQEELLQRVSKKFFSTDSNFHLGVTVIAQNPDGQEMPARIVALDEDEVTLDFNPELAGKTLIFDIKVREIREASVEELEHGHIHGPSGHHH